MLSSLWSEFVPMAIQIFNGTVKRAVAYGIVSSSSPCSSRSRGLEQIKFNETKEFPLSFIYVTKSQALLGTATEEICY